MSLRLSNWKWEFILALPHHLQLSDLQIEHLVTVFCPLSSPLPFRHYHLTAAAISKAAFVLLCGLWPPQKPLPSFQFCPIPELYGAWWAAVHGVSKSRTRLSDFTFTFHFHALEKEMATHSSVLAWRIPQRGSLVGCHLWGHTESDTTEVT